MRPAVVAVKVVVAVADAVMAAKVTAGKAGPVAVRAAPMLVLIQRNLPRAQLAADAVLVKVAVAVAVAVVKGVGKVATPAGNRRLM